LSDGIILHIETSAEICSVALGVNGILADDILDETPRSHARVLTSLTEKLITRNNLKMASLKAVAVSSGPGSYTGLRIGVSAAKGLAYGLNIPLIAVPTCEAMVYGMTKYSDALPPDVKGNRELWFCPVIDARRMEVYCAIYNKNTEQVMDVEAKVVNTGSFREILDKRPVLFFGSGAAKCLEIIKHKNAFFEPEFRPLAEHLLGGSWNRYQKREFEDMAYFEPYYLKDFIPTVPRNRLAL